MKNYLQKGCMLLGFLFCSFTYTYAQSYIGHSIDNYSGIHGVIYNPSAVVDSRVRADINLFSVSAFGGSDYFSITPDNILNSEEAFNLEDDVKKFPKDSNQFFLNTDILGPSFMFNLSGKSSIAITSRVRVFFNLNNINGTLYESLGEDFDENENFDFEMKDFYGTMHAWGELGLTYGHVLVDKDRNFLKGGVTLKYLQGAGSMFLSSPSVTGQYDATATNLTTTGSLSYGMSKDFDSENIDFENLSSGFGGDFGLTYEYRPDKGLDSLSRKDNKYKFKIGVSLTDVGSISYDESTVNSYELNSTVDQSSFEDKDLETVLEENYPNTEEIITSEINLPTAMHVLLDYELKKRLYMSVQGSFSLIPGDREQANRIINTVTATPRLETRWFSMYLPVSLRQYDGLVMGTGVRLGPLMVGSGSIITNLLSDSTKTTDLYVGLKIPIYQ